MLLHRLYFYSVFFFNARSFIVYFNDHILQSLYFLWQIHLHLKMFGAVGGLKM